MANDTISRQAAIATAISGRVRTLPTTEDGENWIRVNEVRDSLLSLPSAERRGRWKYEAGFKYKRGGRNTEAKQIFGTEWRTMQRLKCSVCGMVVLVDDTIKYEYCPHCGARCEE